MTGRPVARILFVVACATPVLLLATALSTRTGLLSPEIGYDLISRIVLFGLAGVGAVAGLAALVLAVWKKAGWLLALVSVAVSVLTLGVYVWQGPRVDQSVGEDVSSDLNEIPGFGPLSAVRSAGGPSGTVGVDACPGALPAMTQSLPESVVFELQKRGFSVRRAGVTGVYGTHRGFWFGFTHDVAVRIRPGRTDIRVAARDDRPHGDQACRLASELSAALRVGERS
ncbi:hypothetical protein ACIQC9_03885 [Brevundimonas sp. NPDC092305]|uniref:hypothetical protein n=1 Tax=Brevundimonas sp. NPDC092305 TaxID=3363957 RepID=UPI0038184BA9